jgi:hypothetical protein
MDKESSDIDMIESMLRDHVEDLTSLAAIVANGGEVDSLATNMASRKQQMIAAIQSLTFLDRSESDLLTDLKAWESLAKQAIDRQQAADLSLEKAETAIRQALIELQGDDSNRNY